MRSDLPLNTLRDMQINIDKNPYYCVYGTLNIPRKATLAQVGETVVYPGASWGATGRLVNAVAAAAAVVHVTMQATFGRPTTHLQQVVPKSDPSSPEVVFCTAVNTAGLKYKKG